MIYIFWFIPWVRNLVLWHYSWEKRNIYILIQLPQVWFLKFYDFIPLVLVKISGVLILSAKINTDFLKTNNEKTFYDNERLRSFQEFSITHLSSTQNTIKHLGITYTSFSLLLDSSHLLDRVLFSKNLLLNLILFWRANTEGSTCNHMTV